MVIKIERPAPGQARITCTTTRGAVVQMELDATRADALTDALEAAGKLGVNIDVPGPVAGF